MINFFIKRKFASLFYAVSMDDFEQDVLSVSYTLPLF